MTVPAGVVVIPLSHQPRWVAAAPTGSRVYVTFDETNPDGTSFAGIGVIDTATHDVTAVEAGASSPRSSGLVVSPDGNEVYVQIWDGVHRCSAVAVLDTAQKTVATTLPIIGSGIPTGIALSRDGQTAYAAAGAGVTENNGRLSFIELSTKQVTTIAFDPNPGGLAVTPDGRRLYVLDHDGGPAVVDLATNEMTFLDAVEGNDRIAITPDGKRAYTIASASGFAGILNLTTNKPAGEAETLGDATDVAVTPDSRFALISQLLGESGSFPLIKIDTATNASSQCPVAWGGTADGLAISADGSHVLVADRRSRALVMIPIALL